MSENQTNTEPVTTAEQDEILFTAKQFDDQIELVGDSNPQLRKLLEVARQKLFPPEQEKPVLVIQPFDEEKRKKEAEEGRARAAEIRAKLAQYQDIDA